MASVNKVILIGNLTRNNELRYTPKGTAVLDNSIACNERRTNDAGEKIENTTFIDVTFWGRTAENVSRYLSKGSSIYIEGKLSLDKWTDQATNQPRSKLKVVAETVQFLGGKKSEGNEQYGGPRNVNEHQSAEQQQEPVHEIDFDNEDDIPF